VATTNKRTHDRGRGGMGLFFLSRSCVSVYRCLEQVQGFFLATPRMSGQWYGGGMCVGKDSFRTSTLVVEHRRIPLFPGHLSAVLVEVQAKP
jgi:hypothetical protein